jgi:hypothetical protein
MPNSSQNISSRGRKKINKEDVMDVVTGRAAVEGIKVIGRGAKKVIRAITRPARIQELKHAESVGQKLSPEDQAELDAERARLKNKKK